MRTAAGERRQVLLSDGTSVQLNTDSAVDIDLGARRLTLVDAAKWRSGYL